MHQITAAQFEAAIELDPAWASKLTAPVEIKNYCYMGGSKITHLSPLLHFTGKNEDGNCANFYSCESLKVAEGTFSGFADFSSSGIEKIANLTCGKNKYGYCVGFSSCASLKIAEGKFEGYVNFAYSGIQKIGDLSCGKDEDGQSAYFWDCKSLKVAEGKFEGQANFANSGIETIGNLTCGKSDDGIRLNIRGCQNLQSIPLTFNPKEIEADPKLLERLEVGRFIQKKRAEIVEVEI